MRRLALFFVILPVACGKLRESPLTVEADKLLTVEADKLLADYRADPVKADARYKDKKITVTGTPDVVNTASDKPPQNLVYFGYLKTWDKDKPPFFVKCFFSNGKTDAVTSLVAGHPAVIVGTCRGADGSKIILVDCDVVRR